jgi:hypothetical protein
MQPCPDEEFAWIRAGREKLRTATDRHLGNLVSHLIPNRFEAYAKILHRIEASYRYIDDPNPLTENENAVLKIEPCTKLRAFVENIRKEGLGRRIKWRALARCLGVPFEPEICSRWFYASLEDPTCAARFLNGPEDGNLNADELSEVISALRSLSVGQECFFRFAEWPYIKTGKPLVFRGNLSDLVTFLDDKPDRRITSEYWWPANRTWCLCSDYDLTFTIIAGPKDLISRILKKSTLEALQVTPQTRIDSLAPIPR